MTRQSEDSDPIWSIWKEISFQVREVVYADHPFDWRNFMHANVAIVFISIECQHSLCHQTQYVTRVNAAELTVFYVLINLLALWNLGANFFSGGGVGGGGV